MAHTVNVPTEFPGSPEEARENFASHAFSYDPDGDSRCYNCDSRPSYTAASYPCGADVPRETRWFLEVGEVVEFSEPVEVQRKVDGRWETFGVATPAPGGTVFLTGVEGNVYVTKDKEVVR